MAAGGQRPADFRFEWCRRTICRYSHTAGLARTPPIVSVASMGWNRGAAPATARFRVRGRIIVRHGRDFSGVRPASGRRIIARNRHPRLWRDACTGSGQAPADLGGPFITPSEQQMNRQPGLRRRVND
jgi:hypothetical protein